VGGPWPLPDFWQANKEMPAFTRIRAHQSTSETQVCEGQKQSQLLLITLPRGSGDE